MELQPKSTTDEETQAFADESTLMIAPTKGIIAGIVFNVLLLLLVLVSSGNVGFNIIIILFPFPLCFGHFIGGGDWLVGMFQFPLIFGLLWDAYEHGKATFRKGLLAVLVFHFASLFILLSATSP